MAGKGITEKVNIYIKNLDEVDKGLEDKKELLAKAVNATTSDFKSRAPGWVSQEVTNIYAIKKKDVTETNRGAKINGKIKVGSVMMNNVELKYRGSLLTPVHFKMTPKKRPKRAYRVSVEIIKSQKKKLPDGVFLADNKGGTQIPFQREGETRLPIKSIKSVSVPQMITGEGTADNVAKRINTEMDKRLKYHIERFNKK